MKKHAITVLCALFSLAAPLSAGEPLKTVPALDLNRYLGRWYEIARFNHSFERDLVGATAEYALRKDGRIDVTNGGYKKTLDGKYSSVHAIAWVPDPAVPGALTVRFFGLFPAEYLVIGLDDTDYRWAVVGDNSRKHLWFLARTPEIAPDTLERMKAIAAAQGYDLSGLIPVPQKAR